MRIITTLLIITLSIFLIAELPNTAVFNLARLKYRGGGDWYQNRTALQNLVEHLNKVSPVKAVHNGKYVKPLDKELFNYPFIYMCGHGRVEFSEQEAMMLRKYLESGGFLWADDDYGMDKYFRKEIKKVFPDKELVELPFTHEIYHSFYHFPNGLPKIHKHDNKPPQGFGIFHNDRLVVFYTYETDIGDGMEDPSIHNDPIEKHQAALKMGTNIVLYALTH